MEEPDKAVKVDKDDFASDQWLDCLERPEFRKFTYTRKPKDWSAPVELTVITYSPTGERAAKWIANAVKKQTGKYDHELAVQYAMFVMSQSHFQFPVRGMVYEGPVFTFVDGVTAKLKNINRTGWVLAKDTDTSPDTNKKLYREIFFSTDTSKDIVPDDLVNNQTGVGKYGRICSYVRKRKAGDPGFWFFPFVREKHKDAMNGDTNLLFEYRLYQFQKASPSGERLADTILKQNWTYYSEGKFKRKSFIEKLKELKVDASVVKTKL